MLNSALSGLPVLEVTLRTPAALAVIHTISKEVPEAVVGAGTICHPDQIDGVKNAGGQFCVSPGATADLLRRAEKKGMRFLPGATTASEILRLLSWGVTFIKFFPAEAAGGLPVLRAFSGPFPQVSFCPTGGIRPQNAPEYLKLEQVRCVGGTWLCPNDALEKRDWQQIEKLARAASRFR